MIRPSQPLARRQLLRLISGGLGAAALAACGLQPAAAAQTHTTAQATRPNVILIVVDALRADHASCYGYTRPTTPNLDAQVAAKGVRFAQATTTAPWTLPANAALLTGRLPAGMGLNWRGDPIPADIPRLTGSLHDAGYYSAGFANTYYIEPRFGFGTGFDLYDYAKPPQGQFNKVRAAAVNDRVLGWLQNTWKPQLSTKPLFLFVYYFDPHPPFVPPQPYDTRYIDPGYKGRFLNNAYGTGLAVLKGEIVPDPADIQYLKDLYDGEISYWDEQLGLLLRGIEALGLLENTLLIVTADHGEQFGEHGKWSHSNSLYEEVMRVPLLLRYSGVLPAGRVVSAPALHLDIMPTIMDLAGLAVPASLPGVSLRGLATGSPITLPRDIFTEVNGAIADPNHPLYWYSAHADLRAIQRDGYKLIHRLGHPDLDELYLLQPASRFEHDNLASLPAHAERTQVMRTDLLNAYYPRHGYIPLLSK